MRAAVVALALLFASTAASATPGEELATARAEFRAGHFAAAQPLFNDLLYPPPPKLASSDELAEAYTNLGVCRAEGGDVDGAKREFEKALQIDPNHQIDEKVVTNKSVVRLFDDTKTDIKTRAERIAAQNQKIEYEKQLALLRANTKLYEAHSFVVNFAPFGIGQFQNNQIGWGVMFASGEGISGGLTFGFWLYLANKYGISCKNCVAPQDASTVRLMQQVEVGSGIAFLVLYAAGVAHSIYTYSPTTSVKVDDDFIKREILNKQRKKKTSLLDHLSPIVTPTGVGLGLSWEN